MDSKRVKQFDRQKNLYMKRTRKTRVEKVMSFHNIRNISAPEDLQNDRKVYIGQFQVQQVLDLPTDSNVRDFLLDAEGKKRKRPTQVHRAILDTITNKPYDFSILNSGITIVCQSLEVNEKNKTITVVNPNIINGSQTQGMLKQFFSTENDVLNDDFSAHVKCEFIVTKNDDLIAEVSIARNYQNDVMTISIAGRLKQLDELEKAVRKSIPNSKLQKSETELSDDYIKTEKLLQIVTALIPAELWIKKGEINKVYTYSMKSKCLKEFQDIYKKAKNKKDPEHQQNKELYKFFLDIAGDAFKMYEQWKTHDGFQGTGLRSIEREGRKIKDVPDGIIFPIICALSEFVRKVDDKWCYSPPEIFNDREIIQAAKSVYMDIAHSNPWNMGKSKACYSALNQITKIYTLIYTKNE